MPLLVLASASPRRRDLLRGGGYHFTAVVPDVDEIAPPHFTPEEIVLANARLKARAVVQPGAVILGVDTVVAFQGEVFGKPGDEVAAFTMLSRLNGHEHTVLSGVCLMQDEPGLEQCWVERTTVRFHTRSESRLRQYLARIGPLDKAGAYAAQDDQSEMIAEVRGSFTNVVGLPMERLATELATFGIHPAG